MKKTTKLTALFLALALVIPVQLIGVFAEEADVEAKLSDELKLALAEVTDPAEKISVYVWLVEPDLSGIDEQVVEKYGERISYIDYVKLYGYVEYYEYYQEVVRPREIYALKLERELKTENNIAFVNEIGLSEETYVDGYIDDSIAVWLTESEIYDIAANEKVRAISYYDTTPHVPDIVYTEELYIGDVNKDGKLSSVDALMIQRYLASYENFTEQQRVWLANVNSDHEVTSIDVLEVLRYVAGYDCESKVGTLEWIPVDDDNDTPGDSDLDVVTE